MSKVIKLQEEEITQLKEQQNTYSTLIHNLGQLENQKLEVAEKIQNLKKSYESLASTLTERYGEGSINLDTGEITLNEKDETAK